MKLSSTGRTCTAYLRTFLMGQVRSRLCSHFMTSLGKPLIILLHVRLASLELTPVYTRGMLSWLLREGAELVPASGSAYTYISAHCTPPCA